MIDVDDLTTDEIAERVIDAIDASAGAAGTATTPGNAE